MKKSTIRKLRNIYFFSVLTFVLIVLCIGNVSAESSYIFKQGSTSTLSIPIVNNDNSKCTLCTCQISIDYPNGTNIITNEITNNNQGYAIYQISGQETDIIGSYKIDLNCNNGVDYGISTLTYDITQSGYTPSSQQIWIMLIIIVVIFLVALLLFIFGSRTEVTAIRIFCLSMSVILIVFLIGYTLNVSNTFITEFTNLTSSFTPLYILFIALISIGGIGLVIYLIVMAVDSFNRHRGLKL